MNAVLTSDRRTEKVEDRLRSRVEDYVDDEVKSVTDKGDSEEDSVDNEVRSVDELSVDPAYGTVGEMLEVAEEVESQTELAVTSAIQVSTDNWENLTPSLLQSRDQPTTTVRRITGRT